jgi:3-oxoacyl-ACP reductase-like protein
MSIFGTIMDKIFHHPAAAAAPAAAAPTAPTAPAVAPAAAAVEPAPAPVDVEAVLTAMAENGNGGNWQTSIVDLLKLLDLDSSLTARKELANELNVHVGADGTAEENIALHKAVMEQLAANGGHVPDSLRH